jgi:FemAB-related protein (PEP-CTERM system-associated)
MSTEIKPIRVALDSRLAQSGAEVKYVLRTLLRIAGYPSEFCWVDGSDMGQKTDIYFGLRPEVIDAQVNILACNRWLTDDARIEPRRILMEQGVPFLDFQRNGSAMHILSNGRLQFTNDIIFACYWLLTGAFETRYARDRWDNFHLDGSFFFTNSLASKPLVSIYGALLREHFRRLGQTPLDLPWSSQVKCAAFAFSHDVDYPEMIRWIECVRLFKTRGPKSLNSIAGVLRGTNHFWKFAEWVEFEKQLGTRPAFYFMARKGSLVQYALGTPDGFYDIRAPVFGKLFHYLRGEGCEIGLHASYHAYRSVEQLHAEREALEGAVGMPVEGNRHHYWHADPVAPYETLHKQEQAGLLYDSSLAFEFYPGFRRGICHPFRVFHPGERRELNILELPPAWMDDHFDRRLAQNKIADAQAYARQLVDAATCTGGVVVVDYHARGMNQDFYPRYGPWLMDFVDKHLDSRLEFNTPQEIARQYIQYEKLLQANSRDLTEQRQPIGIQVLPETPRDAADRIMVDLLQPGEEIKWDAFAAAHPQGNVYHTLAWKAVEEEGLGHKAYCLRALDASGRVMGLLPLFLVKGLFGRRLVSVPMRDRGGVLASNRQAASALVAKAIQLMRELNCKYLELRSLEELDPRVADEHKLRCERYWMTTRIDLAPGVERLWKALDRNAIRWAIGKARREGVRIEIENTESGIDTFYEMFVRTRCSMGIPPFPKSLFESIWRHLIAQGKANLFIVLKDSQPINAMINMLSQDTFIPAYAAPQNRWRRYYPNEFIFWHTIEWAAENGFHYYDFGADSPRQTGLLQFKRKWGGLHQPMFYYYYLNDRNSLPNFDSSTPTYELMRKVWTLLPTPLCEPLGSWVTRQLS